MNLAVDHARVMSTTVLAVCRPTVIDLVVAGWRRPGIVARKLFVVDE